MIIPNDEKLNQIRKKQIIECKCGQQWHFDTIIAIWDNVHKRNWELKGCPSCHTWLYESMNRLAPYTGRGRQPLYKHYSDECFKLGLRKVRSDKKPIEHKRKVTRERVRRWRQAQKNA